MNDLITLVFIIYILAVFVYFLFDFFCLNFKLIEKWMIWCDVFAYGDEKKNVLNESEMENNEGVVSFFGSKCVGRYNWTICNN